LEIDMYKVRAQNLHAQHAHEETPDGPFAHLLDRDDPAFPEIVMALTDIAFELGDPDAVDDDMAKVAIRIGRARHGRQQRDEVLPPKTGLLAGLRETDPRAVVYYIRRGAMVKIGTTIDLRGRMAVLLPEEVLAIEPGDQKLEVQRHRAFRELRVPGQREWFYAGRELQDHIREVLAHHGPPPSGLPTLQPGNGILNA
jgi:hypothetical protein